MARPGNPIKAGRLPETTARPVTRHPPKDDQRFTFSLRYWQQTKNFELGNADSSWFISVLNRLHDLSKEKVARFQTDREFRNGIRYHEIDWKATGIKTTLGELDWVPKTVISNSEEFPFYQFQVSTALGRIHGYWDTEWCFQIVLVDYYHNLQPSAYSDYKIRDTQRGDCHFSTLKLAVDQIKALDCASPENCRRHQNLMSLSFPSAVPNSTIVVANLPQDVLEKLHKLCSQSQVTVSDVFESGIAVIEEMK